MCSVFTDLHAFIPILSSETKIPLWRWQRMMIFMLANTIICIVTSVLLNVVDHRQVRHPQSICTQFYASVAYTACSCLFFCRAGPLTRQPKGQGRLRATRTESRSDRQWKSRMRMRRTYLILPIPKFSFVPLPLYSFIFLCVSFIIERLCRRTR